MRLLVLAVLVGCASSTIAEAAHRVRSTADVNIGQAQGRVPAGAVTMANTAVTPSGALRVRILLPRVWSSMLDDAEFTGGSGTMNMTIPVTCNQQNETWPACHTATLQYRHLAR
jgi:hypothetical protein